MTRASVTNVVVLYSSQVSRSKDWTEWLMCLNLGFKAQYPLPCKDYSINVPCLRGIIKFQDFRLAIQGFWSNHRCNLYPPSSESEAKLKEEMVDKTVAGFLWATAESNEYNPLINDR